MTIVADPSGSASCRIVALACLLSCACNPSSFTQISNTPAGAFEASLAPLQDGFMAAWYDTRDGHAEIYMRRLDAQGQAAGPERRLTTGGVDAYEADIAPIRDGVVVGWYEAAKGTPARPKLGAFAIDGTARWVKPLATRGRNTVVRTAGGLVFAAWIEDEEDDRAGVWITWRRSDGVDLIAPRRVADAGKTTWNLNAAVAPDASPGHPLAWVVFDAKAGTKSEELFLVETGESSDRVVRLTPDDGAPSKYPDLALTGNRAAVTWFDKKDGNDEVYLAIRPREALMSGPLAASQRITSTPGHSIGAYVAWNGERLGLAWCDDAPGNQELYFQSFNRDGRADAAPTRVTTTSASSSIPAIKPHGSGFALLWNEHDPISGDGHGAGRLKSQIVFRTMP